MIIIYHCFGGSHSSVAAAALHLGLLDSQKIPTEEDLIRIPYYDKTTDADFGSIRYMGTDNDNNHIYVFGKRSFNNRYAAVLKGVARMLGDQDDLVMVDCMKRVNLGMKIGGYTSRRLGLIAIGRPIVSWGTRMAFAHLVNLVEITRFRILGYPKKTI